LLTHEEGASVWVEAMSYDETVDYLQAELDRAIAST